MINKLIFKILLAVILVSVHLFSSSDLKKFQIELSANLNFANPTHLNYFPETEKHYLIYYFDPIYDGKSENGALKSIKSLYTIQTKIKYAITASLDVSIGFSYLWKTSATLYRVEYNRNESWRTISDVLDYPQFDTKVTGYIPTIGLHYHFPLFRRTRLEFSLAGGPLFASVDHNKRLEQSLNSRDNQTYLFYTSEKSLRMEGNGTGISLTGSIKFQQPISQSLGVAIEGGYAWQRINKITGNAVEFIDGYYSHYNGEWGLVKEKVQIFGNTEFIFPTNNWQVFKQKSEDFILDLSGIYISIGLYINL